MDNTISNLSILAMAFSALIGIAIPVVLYCIFRKKGANHLPFWTGAVTFVLFAFVLEQVAYFFIMKTALWTTIVNNVILLGVFGGFMAGLFEETGRFIAFKTVLRRKRWNDQNALMYGAGHGGVEAVILLSVGMIINVIFSLQFNAGQSSAFGGLDAAQQLINTPFWMFFVGAIERVSAVTIHITLSVLVWFAAKDGKKFWLYPLAIFLHLLVDAVAVILSRSGINVWLIEGAVGALTIAFVLIAIVVWRKNHVAQAVLESMEESTDMEQTAQETAEQIETQI